MPTPAKDVSITAVVVVAATRRKRPPRMQHRLKASPGSARARVVPTESLDQLLVVTDDAVPRA